MTIEVSSATSVNVYEITIALEEMELPYQVRLIDIGKGKHLDPKKMVGLTNGQISVIRYNHLSDSGEPLVIFESGRYLII